jgi:polyisoprenyl-phosphate glycosyltransferase
MVTDKVHLARETTDSNPQCAVCGESLLSGPHMSVVVPMFKSEDHIPGVVEYVTTLSRAIPGGIRATFVIDGSPENERYILPRLLETLPFPAQIVRLSRNFGVGPALHAALTHCGGCATVVFGSDLQEPYELFVDFSHRILVNGTDVALGQRASRDDPFTMRLFASFYWWINRKFLANDTPKGGFDVFGVSERARDALVSLPELNTNITSQLQWIGFDRVYVPFHRRARQSGKSTWSMKRKVKLFADSIYGFTGAPVALITFLGVLSLGVFGTLSMLTLVGSLMNLIEVPGYATLLLVSATGHSATILACGIIGGYVYRTFENSKSRPRYVIAEIITPKSFGIAGTVDEVS